MERSLIECRGCGRLTLGVVDDDEVEPLVGTACSECGTGEFRAVEREELTAGGGGD